MKSIGELLKRAREKKKLTIEEVYRIIKIHPKYIMAMEKDQYDVFSSKVHSKGFLKIYSDFLGLDQNEVLALWRRDYEKEIEAIPKKEFVISSELYKPKFIITPGLVFITLTFLSLILFFAYLFYQYKTYTGVPVLEVYSPGEEVISVTDIVDITGKTDLDSEIFINNEQIILGPDGSFARSVKLKEGMNTISIKSVNKLGKENETVRTIIYRPEKKDNVMIITPGSIPSDSLPAGSSVPGVTSSSSMPFDLDIEIIAPGSNGSGGLE